MSLTIKRKKIFFFCIGLQRIEAANDGGLEASYDLEMTEVVSNNDSIGGNIELAYLIMIFDPLDNVKD